MDETLRKKVESQMARYESVPVEDSSWCLLRPNIYGRAFHGGKEIFVTVDTTTSRMAIWEIAKWKTVVG